MCGGAGTDISGGWRAGRVLLIPPPHNHPHPNTHSHPNTHRAPQPPKHSSSLSPKPPKPRSLPGSPGPKPLSRFMPSSPSKRPQSSRSLHMIGVYDVADYTSDGGLSVMPAPAQPVDLGGGYYMGAVNTTGPGPSCTAVCSSVGKRCSNRGLKDWGSPIGAPRNRVRQEVRRG